MFKVFIKNPYLAKPNTICNNASFSKTNCIKL